MKNTLKMTEKYMNTDTKIDTIEMHCMKYTKMK